MFRRILMNARMTYRRVALLLPVLFCLTAPRPASAAGGIAERLSGTTITLPQNPRTFGFAEAHAFPPQTLFTNPIAFATPPGETNRLFILERPGRVVAITNLAAPNRTVVLNLNSAGQVVSTTSENGLLGIAFHPQFASNRYFYLFYSRTNVPGAALPTHVHQRVARFEMTATNNNVALLASELPLITQRDEANNHNGGDIQFGPDGYLYIAVGDEGGANDQWNNSQTIRKDFFAGILRIDVDKCANNPPPNPHPAHFGQTNYSVPAGNPWVSAPLNTDTNLTGEIRTEFYAVGLRNPWRITFDPATGELWAGDVGQSGNTSREEVDYIVKGGNYGWAFREGFDAGPPAKAAQTPPGFQSIGPSLFYARNGNPDLTGRSITGGVVHRGRNQSQLYGKYIFADFESNNVWAATLSGTNNVSITNSQLLMKSSFIATFGVDPRNGDVLIGHLTSNAVTRLGYSAAASGTPLPATLADTGLFSTLATLTPAAGVVPYAPILPAWADGANALHWFSLPDTNTTIGWSATNAWQFPTGAVFVQHFNLVTNHLTAQSTRVETRVLTRHSNGVYGATYRWGGAANPSLVAESGTNETFVITDPGGILRTQLWNFPARADCLACHNAAAGYVLGFRTEQLTGDLHYTGFPGAGNVTEPQLAALNNAGYFNPPPGNLNLLRSLAAPGDPGASLEWKIRSYAAVNCGACHFPGGPSIGSWDARPHTPLADAGWIDGALANMLCTQTRRVIVRGATNDSMNFLRLAGLSGARMPPLGTTRTDTNAVALMASWINSAALVGWQSFAEWQVANFGSTGAANAQPDADPDGDGLRNSFEHLIGTSPNDATSGWSLGIQMDGDTPQLVFTNIANRLFEVQVRTNLGGMTPWLPLNAPGNAPMLPPDDMPRMVEDTTGTGTNKAYRVRVSAP